MSAVIDLMSSDEEHSELPIAAKTTENAMPSPTSASTSTEDPTLANAANKESQKEASQNKSTEPNIPNSHMTIASAESTIATPPTTDQRIHRRKSQHQRLRTSPEIEFESLSPQKRILNEGKKNLGKCSSALKKKNIKKISILAPKPLTCEQLLDIEFEKLLKDQTTLNLLREIAAERVRLNQILCINFMPEINFSLYTTREMLEFQLTERFKQKEICLKSFSETQSKVN